MALNHLQQLGGERAAPATGSVHDLQVVLETMPNMVWTAADDGCFDWCNDEARRFLGDDCASEDRTWLGFVHPEDLAQGRLGWTKAVAASSSFEAEMRLRRADGEFCWQIVRCRPIRAGDKASRVWVASCTDITKLRATADSLARDNEQLEQDIFNQLHEVKRTQSRLQTYFDASPEYLCLMRRTNDGGLVFEDANPASVTVFGMDRTSVIGRSPAEIVDAPSAQRLGRYVTQCLRTGKPVQYSAEMRFANNASRYVDIVGAPLEYSNEEEGLVLLCGRDVTEQRSIEDALRQSQKMEAVGQLTGGLAHDFNNLLTGITGSLDLLRSRIAQGRLDAVDRYVTAAQDAAGRAASLTHRLLAFSRRQTLDPKPTDTNRLVVEMGELIQRTVGPEITLHLETAPDLWIVLVDPSQLENALLNLCINARDAMPDGGRISIETRNLHFDPQNTDERDLPAGDYVALSVTDSGTGMPPEIIARIFDPFFTTKPLGSGTGLGLSMIYGFARQSGGHVRVQSTVGVGTTMRILLPRHIGEVEEPIAAASLNLGVRSGAGETVLVVDDEATVRMLVKEVLQDLGYHALEAVDGKTGARLLQSDRRIDLLVTDVGLPGGMNGRQLAEIGRAGRPLLKILFITGYAENAVFNHGHLDARMQVITKPFAMEALASRIKLMFNETPR